MSLVNWHGIHHSKEERSSIRSFLENPKPFRFSFVQLGSLHKIGHKISNSATLNLLTFAAASAARSSRVSYRNRARGEPAIEEEEAISVKPKEAAMSAKLGFCQRAQIRNWVDARREKKRLTFILKQKHGLPQKRLEPRPIPPATLALKFMLALAGALRNGGEFEGKRLWQEGERRTKAVRCFLRRPPDASISG